MPRQIEARAWGRGGALAAFVVVSAAAAPAARANPRPLPFTYQTETLPKGALEVEQFVDLLPIRVDENGHAGPVWYLASQYQTEFELGLTDRLEIGLYLTLVPQPAAGQYGNLPAALPEGNGVKQRLRYRLADAGAWPVDVALYGELSENEREIEFEGKVILQRRVNNVRFITNLWAEREYYLDGHREWALDPTLGVTAELTPRYNIGAESWMRAEYRDGGGHLGPHVYVGPAFMMNFGRMWWSNGVYLRVTNLDRPVTDNGDPYGRFWVRTIVGLSF